MVLFKKYFISQSVHSL